MHGAAFFSEPLSFAADAQKRQKTPLIVVKSSLFIASRRVPRGVFVQNTHENTSRNTTV